MLQSTINSIRPLNAEAMEAAQKHLDFLLKPQGSLGKLEDIAKQMAGITGNVHNSIRKKAVMIGCSDNGIYEEGVASFPQNISMLVAECMVSGISGVAALAKHANADLHVVDLGLNIDVPTIGIINRKIRNSTSNFAKTPAMSREEAIKAIEIGIEETNKAIENGYDLFATGEVGIANTTTSSAMLHGFTGKNLDLLVGRGAGLDNDGLARKKESIRKAFELHQPNPNDPLDILAKVGGFDIAFMAGVYLAAAAQKKPVVMDGFISGVAAILATRLCPLVKGYIFPSHGSAEPGAKVIFEELQLEPMLMMNMRLGEGTGAVLAFGIIESALAMMNNQGTFGDVGLA